MESLRCSLSAKKEKVGANNENKICEWGYIKKEGGVKGLPLV